MAEQGRMKRQLKKNREYGFGTFNNYQMNSGVTQRNRTDDM